jgi:hypothetical protein
MDKIVAKEGETKDPINVTKETIVKKQKKRAQKEQKEVKPRKTRKNAPKDSTVHDNETPRTLVDINTEFQELDGSASINMQHGGMKELIEPKVDTLQAIQANPDSFGKVSKYYAADPNVSKHTSTVVEVLPSLSSTLLEKVHAKLKKPIQPPARMGYLKILDEPTEFF